MVYATINSLSNQKIELRVCDTFWTKFIGLMFRKSLSPNKGLLFKYAKESIINTSIHMLFMRFPITVLWINTADIIVDKCIAHPWRLMYASKYPACSVIEVHTQVFDDFLIGCKIVYNDEI